MFITFGLDTGDTPDVIERYAECGAEEFFAGFVPKEWLEKYGWEVCPNRRSLGGGYNYTQVSELKAVANTIHRLGKRLNLAVNAQDNGQERLADLRNTVEIMEEFQPDGYIVADPSVMISMGKWGIQRPLHLSTGAGCFSADAIRFFCEHFNVRRVVIPRKMTLDEMRRMLEKLADLDVEFEVMIIGYRCFFNDEDCHSVHSGCRRNLCGDILGAQLMTSRRFPQDWKDAMEEVAEKGLGAIRADSRYNRFLLSTAKPAPPPPEYRDISDPRGLAAAIPKGLFQHCGLCAIRELRDMGVHALKVPFRGTQGFKLPALQIVRQVMTHPNPTPEYCRNLIGSPAFCDALVNCYYHVPEAHT